MISTMTHVVIGDLTVKGTMTIDEIETDVIKEITETAKSGMVDETRAAKSEPIGRNTFQTAMTDTTVENVATVAAPAETVMEVIPAITADAEAEAEIVTGIREIADQAAISTDEMVTITADPVDETAEEEALLHPVPTHQVMERTLTLRAATLATAEVEDAIICVSIPETS